MSAAELLLEHKHRDRFLKSIKLNSPTKTYIIGTSKDADIRLAGNDVAVFHAIIEYRKPFWYVFDFGSSTGTWVDGASITEKRIEKTTVIQIGQNKLRVSPQNLGRPLFVMQSSTSIEGADIHQVIVRNNTGIISTHLIGKTEPFEYLSAGKTVRLPAPQTSAWTQTKLDQITVQQRLTKRPKDVEIEKMSLDEGLKTPTIAAFIFLIALGLVTWLFPRGSHDAEYIQPLDRQFSEMIYSAKVVQKKREESVKIQAKAPSAAMADQRSDNPVSSGKPNAPKTNANVSKAISQIRASGLDQLIGKIAKRASKTGLMVTAQGVMPDQESGRVLIGAAGSLKNLAKTGEGSQGSFKMTGVATQGRAGGSAKYKEGTGLATGSVGQGEVGLVDEESIVDGGLDREVIADIIRRDIGQIRFCYERQLSANPELFGKVLVKFMIGPDGLVSAPQVGSTTLNNAMVEGCILRRVARWKFPLPKGGTSVLVSYPFLFKTTDN